MTHTTSEVLDLAADLIERHGWTQGTEGLRPSGPYCLMGSVGAVVNAPTLEWAGGVVFAFSSIEATAAMAAVREYMGVRPFSSSGMSGEVYGWNDAPDRTATEVIATLRAAALIEAAKENADARERVTP